MATIGTAIRLNDMMTAPIRNITNAMNMMLSTWTSLEGATAGGLNVGDVEAIRTELNKATTALDQMGNEQEDFNRKVNEGTHAADGLTNKIMGAVGAFVGLQSIGKLVNLSDNFTQTQSRLSMIVDMPTLPENISEMEEMAIRQEKTDELFDKIAASANRSRASIATTADTVAKLSLNAGDAFSSNDETILFAENLNKLFVIAGTEQASIASASLQLTQALGSGVLRGEEFNAVFEAAPNIMQTVADYMDVPIGKLRSMAQEGQITADVVKNALLSATGDINNQFESMPMTWGQVWTGVMNKLYLASIPVLEAINWMAQNWSILEPIVLGVATAVGLYTAALLINKSIQAASAAITTIKTVAAIAHGAAITAEMTATSGMTAAQLSFNAALYACPLTWIVLIIVAVIAVIYAVVAAINKWKNTTVSATGVIVGALMVAGAVILNIAIGVLNAIIQAGWSFVEPFIGIVEWVLNACNGGFNGFGGAVANLIGQIISWFLSLGKIVTAIIDAVFGTDWTSGLSALQDDVLGWGKNEKSITLDRNAPLIEHQFEYGDAWDFGYGIGEGIEDSVGGFFGGDSGIDLAGTSGDIPVYDEIANNTDRTANALEITNENLKYLRDSAEQEAVNRFTTAEVRVEMTNHNNISSSMDLDGIVDYVVTGVQEALERTAEGVHN